MGINTLIIETKNEILDLLNSKLQKGLPITVIGLMMENIQNEINMQTSKVLEEESKELEKTPVEK